MYNGDLKAKHEFKLLGNKEAVSFFNSNPAGATASNTKQIVLPPFALIYNHSLYITDI